MATNSGKPAADAETEAAGSEPSLEELQRQLAEMEATQSELANRLQQQTELTEPQLDSRLAVIEEQFRRSFDDRLREAGAQAGSTAARRGSADSTDMLVENRVLREVSRCMADEWRPVFDKLMSSLPQDVVEHARDALQQHPPLIQGYRALLAWREATAEQFDIHRLIDVLRSCNMDDVADVAVALLNRDRKSTRLNSSH